MRILTNVSKAELDYLTTQPTAREMIDKVKNEGIYIPEGDVQAATDFVEMRNSQKQAAYQIPMPKDEYISSEKSGLKPSGLYRMGQDENGNPKVLYDDPKKAQMQSSSQPTKKAEKCTTDTDAVDREIEKLKEEKKQIEQQIKSEKDENKVKELEKRLAQIEIELSQKDNDAYRRQNAIVS